MEKELRSLALKWRTESNIKQDLYRARFRNEEMDEKEARKHIDQWIGIAKAATELSAALDYLTGERTGEAPKCLAAP
jgi:hypothetical protein